MMNVQGQLFKRSFVLAVVAFVLFGRMAIAGTGSTGGGNPEEGDFISAARAIHLLLNQNPGAAEAALSVSGLVDKYLEAIDSTPVECAGGAEGSPGADALERMKRENKKAYYIEEYKRIFLDCSRYEEFRREAPASQMTLVFHEYMRVLGLEGSDYRISSRLPGTLRILTQKSVESVRETGKDYCTNQRTLAWSPGISTPGDEYCRMGVTIEVELFLKIQGDRFQYESLLERQRRVWHQYCSSLLDNGVDILKSGWVQPACSAIAEAKYDLLKALGATRVEGDDFQALYEASLSRADEYCKMSEERNWPHAGKSCADFHARFHELVLSVRSRNTRAR